MKKAFVRFYTKIEATSSKVNQTIRCYNEKMFEIEKLKIYKNFMREDFIIRILCVTNVMKLDMNILDVNIIMIIATRTFYFYTRTLLFLYIYTLAY
jgi:hypothetical protein